MKKYIMKSNIPVLIGFIFVISGCILLSYDYLCGGGHKLFEDMDLAYLDQSSNIGNAQLTQVDDPKLDEKLNDDEKTVDESNEYIGKISIPKINLVKGFVSKDSKNNNISRNVTILKEANMPDVDKGNFILVAHSGDAYISFFRNLYKLSVNDVAYIYYNDIKYTYQIKDIYDVEKNGTVSIRRNYDVSTLTLVTCTYHDDYHQTVYIAELIEKAEV